MYLFKTVKSLQDHLNQCRLEGKKIGFAPTMGALHQGHISLIAASKEENEVTVCSIFVNPKQFNDASDFEKYPITTTPDIILLEAANCDVLFMPTVKEVYPDGMSTKLDINIGQLLEVMEGEFRPGHFDGMMEVVKRLLDIVQPNNLYMGQKDFQQFSIVHAMIKKLELPYQIVMCPIIREEDGLAMSSRNVRLSKELRAKASLIFKTISKIKEQMASQSPKSLEAFGMKALTKPDFKPEYVRIVDGETLLPIEDWDAAEFIVVCVATWLGEIRLIDNLVLKGNPSY